MGMDAFSNAMEAFSMVNSAFDRKRQLDQQERMDAENLRLREEENRRAAETHALQTQKLQQDVNQQRELEDVNYFGSRVRQITAALDKSNMNPTPATDQAAADTANQEDPYNRLVDEVWADKRFQEISKKPWAQDLLTKATDRVQTYNDFGNQLVGIFNQGDELVSAGHLKGDGKHQELSGPPAQSLFDNIARQRTLNNESFPANIDRNSIRFVSPDGGDGWVLDFKYTNDKGQVVPGVATANRTKHGEPGFENDIVIRKSIPQLLEETRTKRDSNLALAMLQARATAGDRNAQNAINAIDAKTVERQQQQSEVAPIIQNLKRYAPAGYEGQLAAIETAAANGGVNVHDALKFSLDIQKDIITKTQDTADAAASLKIIKSYLEQSGNRKLKALGATITEDAFRKPKTALAAIETLRKAIHEETMEESRTRAEAARANRPDKTEAALHLQSRSDIAARLREAQRGYQAAVKTGDPDAINEAVSLIENLNESGSEYGVTPMPVPSRVFSVAEEAQIKEQAVKNLKEQRQGIAKFFGKEPNVPAINQEAARIRKTVQPGNVSFATGHIPQSTQRPREVMPAMPQAAQHRGRIVRDTVTGKRYQSNGTTWQEVR